MQQYFYIYLLVFFSSDAYQCIFDTEHGTKHIKMHELYHLGMFN